MTITSWSYSSYNTWKQCPFKAKLLYVEKLKEPSSAALDNGQQKHQDLEYYLRGFIDGIPSWVHPRSHDYITSLKARKATPELSVAFNDKWQPVEWFAKNAWVRIKIDALLSEGTHITITDWKGLALNTQIPTPSGFVTMAAIAVGDTVFDMNGSPCKVIHKSQVKTLPMYEIQFKDGAKVVCDEEHLWLLTNGHVHRVTDIGKGDRIPLQNCIDLPEVDLPVHPYVLGYWLGNGRKRDGSICSPERVIFDYIRLLGYSLGENIGGKRPKDQNVELRTVAGLRGSLAQLDLLNNKHIPAIYLRSSKEQRLALLQGLMDSDGSANVSRQEAVFSNTNRKLLADFRELLSSLGVRFRSNTGYATGFGLTVKATQIAFRMPKGLRAFATGPKAHKESQWDKPSQYFRVISCITPVGTGQSQCIGVDSPTSTYLCTNRFVVTHNTGKIRDGEYDEQLDLYGLTGMLMFPSAETVSTELVFPELGVKLPRDSYIAPQKDELRKQWEARVEPMLNDSTFEATPNVYCKYCHFRQENGGPCKY